MSKARPYRFLNLIQLLILIGIISIIHLTSRQFLKASDLITVVDTSQEDFQAGVANNLDLISSPGDLSLPREKTIINLENNYSPTLNTELQNNQIKLSTAHTYSPFSSPALSGNDVTDAFIDERTGYLYVNTGNYLTGAVNVIDLENNTLVKRYDKNFNSIFSWGRVYNSFLDVNTGYLYVNVNNSGLTVIDTNSDSIVRVYSTTSNPALLDNYVNHTFIDERTNYLYVSQYGGQSVIDLNTNTLVATYLAGTGVLHAFIDERTDYLYLSTYGLGVRVIDITTGALVTSYTDAGGVVRSCYSHIFRYKY